MSNGWQTHTLGEVCSFLNRGISPKYLETGGISVLNQRCIRDHRVSYECARRHDAEAKKVDRERFVQAGDVLVNSTGTGTLGRVAQHRDDPPEPTTVDSHVTIVRPAPRIFCREFFGYMLRDIEDKLKNSGEGCGGQTELARSVLAEKFTVRYPTALSEQQRIVGILDEAFDSIATAKANAEKNLENVRALFENYMGAVFGQCGVGWVDMKLGNVCHKITDGTHKTPTYTKSGVPFLSVKNLTKGFIDFSETRFISAQEHHALTKRCKPVRDDILYTKVGTTGVAQVVDVDDDFSIFVSVALLKVKHQTISCRYLAHFLNAPYAREQARKRTRGMANKNLVITDIKEIGIHFPNSLDQQRSIVARLDSFQGETNRLESIYQKKLAALDELKRSLLRQAFSGQL